jgi:hypothetical protein
LRPYDEAAVGTLCAPWPSVPDAANPLPACMHFVAPLRAVHANAPCCMLTPHCVLPPRASASAHACVLPPRVFPSRSTASNRAESFRAHRCYAERNAERVRAVSAGTSACGHVWQRPAANSVAFRIARLERCRS